MTEHRQQHTETTSRIHPIAPFGPLPKPPTIETLGIDISIGTITALRAKPQSRPVQGVALLVPGFTGSKEDFYDLMPLLQEHGWDVWAISQRGQADSVAPVGVDSYSRDKTAQDVIDIAHIIRNATNVPKLHLLGHSFGGTVGQAAVINASRMSQESPFASLSLMSSGPHGWPGRHAEERRLLAEHPETDLWRITNATRATVPDESLSSFSLHFRRRSESTSRDQLIGAIYQLADVHDTTDEIQSTGLPVLIFHGEDDGAWPQEWQKRMANILNARYAVIPAAAHCPNTENPEPTAELIDDFWSSIN